MRTPDSDIYNKPFLYLSVLLWVFLVHYYQQFIGGSGLSAPYNSTTWMGVSLITALAFYKISTTRKFYWDMQDIILSLFGISLALPLLWSEPLYAQLTYNRYFAIFAFIILVALIKQFQLTRAQNEALYLIIVVSGFIESILSIFAYISPEAIDNYIWGGNITQAFGIFQQPNLSGSFIATTVALSFYLQLSTQTLSNRWRLFLRIAFTICISAIVLTESRTVIIGTIVSLITLSWIMFSKKNIRELIKIWGLVISGIILAFIWSWLRSLFDEGISGLNIYNTNVSVRLELYKVSTAMILEHPFSGWGLGSFQAMFMERFLDATSQSILDSNIAWTHPHNELLFLALEGGIFPAIAAIITALVTAITSSKGGRKSRALLFVAFPIVFHTMTEYPLYQSAPHLILLAILLAEMSSFKTHALEMKTGKVSYIMAWMTPLIIIPLMLINLHTTNLLNKFLRDGENPENLTKIISYWGQNKTMNAYKVIALIQNPSTEGMRMAAQLARYEMKVRPSKSNYINLIYILNKIGKHSEIIELKNRWDKKGHPKVASIKRVSALSC